MQSKGILCPALLLFALFRASLSQGDCSCNISIWGRRFCAASPFARNQRECEAAGCCYSTAVFSAALQCYERDLSGCPQSPGPGIDCVAATPLRQCGFGLNEQTCESVGCCYFPDYSPFCFFADSGTNSVDQLTSDWGQWSGCSSACSTGTKSRSRKCLAQNPLECNQRAINLAETEICNVGICNSWNNWVASPCSVSCGRGTFTYTRTCRSFATLGSQNCHSVVTACNQQDCPIPTVSGNTFQILGSWSQWFPWQVCSNPCGPGKQSRARNCVLNGVVVRPERCPINIADGTSSVQTEDCNLALCSIWTNWAPSTSCTATCGSRATRFATRRCTDISRVGTGSRVLQRCSSRQEPCILSICPTKTASTTQSKQTAPPNNVFTLSPTASSAQPTTPTGAGIFTIVWSSSSTTSTSIQASVEPRTTSTVGAATNGPTRQNTSPTTDSSTHSTTSTPTESDKVSVIPSSSSPLTATVDPEGFATTTPPFWESTVPEITFGPEERPIQETTVPRATEIVASWSPWSTWSVCSKTCGAGSQIRTRICLFNNGTATESSSDCGTTAIETSGCNDQECAISSPAPTESTTVESNTTLRRMTDTTTAISQLPTTGSDRAEWETWQPWSECSSTCSPGLRTRSRACKRMGNEVEPTECNRADPGSMYDEGECNTNLCLRWSARRSTGCSVTCNRGEDEPPGVILTRRRCLEPEAKRAGETCYLVSDICNATKPCPVSSTTPQPTTETSIASTSSTSSTTESFTTTKSPSSTQSSGDIWAEWDEWSSCSSSCSPGIQTRERQCLPNVPQQLCTEGGFMSRACNREFCTGWSGWRTMPCDRTCGDDGSQVRRRICLSGQPVESMPESCHRVSQPCESSLPCEEVKSYPKQDILFLVDSSTHVDDCASIKKTSGLSTPLRTPQLTDKIAPTYARIKKFMTDFADAWQGISNDGTRIGIQLISGLCNGRTRANLYVEKRYNETHELLKEYIAHMPYLCGDFWLDWAMQCSYSPVMSERYGDRKDVPNLVVAIVSHVPAASLPRESLLKRIIKRLRTKATILSATATNTTTIGPVSRKRYIEHTQKIACPDGTQCSRFLGSIWDMESSAVADKIRGVLDQLKKP